MSSQKTSLTQTLEFSTPAELALRLRVSRQHVSNLIARGDLAAIRVGDRLIIATSEVERFLRENSTAARPKKAA